MLKPPGLLSVHPHPDDESIACGGVLAKYAHDGYRVKVVTCTGGEEGDNLANIDLGGRSLAEVRRDELANALAELGVSEHEYLGYRDSGMAGSTANRAEGSFHGADVADAAGKLASVMRDWRPAVVISDDERGTYGHPDHVKAHLVTTTAIELCAQAQHRDGREPWLVSKHYVIAYGRSGLWRSHLRLRDQGLPSPWGENLGSEADLPFGVPDDQITTRVDVSDYNDNKRAAMAAHRSQIAPESFFLNSPPSAWRREDFVCIRGLVGNRPEDDLFAGLS